MIVTEDTDRNSALDTHFKMRNAKQLFFAAVTIAKRYVSFHLMPVYVEPALPADASRGLMEHRHGKPRFNFTRVEAELFSGLETLIQAGYAYYVEAGYITQEER